MINDRVEILILKSLISNEEYTRKVIPFLREEYFTDESEKVVFKKINDFVTQFNSLPSVEALSIEVSKDPKIPNGLEGNIIEVLSKIGDKPKNVDDKWLIQETEKFCQDKAIYNAVLASVDILNDKTGKKSRGVLPQLLQEALAITFDPHIGHTYIEDADKQYEFYHRVEEKIPFDLKYFNKITSGGVTRKTLNVIMAGTGVGKSLTLCHLASAAFLQGKNVLYITLEMSEERITERIDANILNIDLDNLQRIPRETYDKKIAEVKKKTIGRLVVKEYPTATANCNHFRALLQELNLKKNFIPDIIFVDYLNIAASTRINQQNGTYAYVKAIAEELRGLGQEKNVPIWTATQTNRDGYNNSDVGLENVSESFGLPQTADLILAMISTPELEQMRQVLFKQLKNRYNDVNSSRCFIVGIDRPKMRLFDVDDSAQKGITDGDTEAGTIEDDTPAFDKTSFGNGMKAEKRSFDDFKF